MRPPTVRLFSTLVFHACLPRFGDAERSPFPIFKTTKVYRLMWRSKMCRWRKHFGLQEVFWHNGSFFSRSTPMCDRSQSKPGKGKKWIDLDSLDLIFDPDTFLKCLKYTYGWSSRLFLPLRFSIIEGNQFLWLLSTVGCRGRVFAWKWWNLLENDGK